MRMFVFGGALVAGWLSLQACGGGDSGSDPSTDASTSPDGATTGDGGADGPSIPTVPTKLDPSCGTGGRAVFPIGVGDSADEGRSLKRLPDGRTLLVGTVDEPVDADSIQSAYFASTVLTATCAIDTTYGSNGLTWFPASNPDYQVEDIHRAIHQRDGSTLLFGVSIQPLTSDAGTASHPAVTVVRMLADGTRDTSFGTQFLHLFSTADAPYPDDYPVYGVEAQPDGSIRVLARSGGARASFALLTFEDGAFDPSKTIILPLDGLGSGGTLSAWRTESLHVLADGSTLIGGSFEREGTTSDLPGVLKLLPDGKIDTSFGNGGVAGVGSAGDVEGGTFLAIQPDGKILLAGVFHAEGRYQSFGVVRFDAKGVVDRTFGNAGVARVDLGETFWTEASNPHELRAFTLNADGSMLLGGELYSLDADDPKPESNWHVGVTRLLSNGALDTSFATGGRLNGASLSAGAPEHFNAFEQTDDGTVSILGTRDNTQHDHDWVIFRLTRQP